MDDTETHWTEGSTDYPHFSTVIRAYGPGANLMEIIGKARSMMRQLGIPARLRDEMSTRAMSAGSYKDALAVVREWFPVETDGDDE